MKGNRSSTLCYNVVWHVLWSSSIHVTPTHPEVVEYLGTSQLQHMKWPTHIDWWRLFVGMFSKSETIEFSEIHHTLLRNASWLLLLMLTTVHVHTRTTISIEKAGEGEDAPRNPLDSYYDALFKDRVDIETWFTNRSLLLGRYEPRRSLWDFVVLCSGWVYVLGCWGLLTSFVWTHT